MDLPIRLGCLCEFKLIFHLISKLVLIMANTQCESVVLLVKSHGKYFK